MRILLLTQWSDPEPTLKGLHFAQELQGRGHDVQVITGFPNYPGGKVYDGHRVRAIRREVHGGVAVVRVPSYPSHDRSASHRILSCLSFSLSATFAALVVRRPDVVYVHHPPATTGLPALVLKTFRGVPFVYDVQDLRPDTLAASGTLANKVVLGVVGHWMRLICRASARVVVPADGFRGAISSRGTPPDKITVIHNWADENRIQATRPGPERATELGFDGKFNIVFAGAVGPAQGLPTVLDAADLLRDEPGVRFVLIGGGTEDEGFMAEADSRGLSNVTFMAGRPAQEIGEILGVADALLVHLKENPLLAITVPPETQVYLLAGRPVLMGVRGDAAALVQAADAGLVFEPECPDQLAAAVLRLKEMTAQERMRLGTNGSRFYREHLSLDVGVNKFLRAFDQARLARPRLTFTKRAADIVASVVALVILGLPMALLAILVRRKLGSPVLFRQTRPGRHGQPFEMIKFRSMTDARDESGDLLSDHQRLTPFGARLRSYSLDELPEFWNVLKGQMSLIGPRPLLARYTEYYTDEERIRLLVKPGISGWAQVNGRNASPWDERLGMDAWYVRNRSVRLDARIVFMTLTRVLRKTGVVVDSTSEIQDFDDERRDRMGVT